MTTLYLIPSLARSDIIKKVRDLMQSVYIFTLALAFIVNAFLIQCVLLKFGGRSSVTIPFIIFLTGITIWSLSVLLIHTLPMSDRLYTFLDKFASLGYITVPPAFTVFSLVFTKRKAVINNLIFWLLLVSSAVLFLYLSWTSNAISVHSLKQAIYTEWGIFAPNGNYFVAFLIWLEYLMLVSLYYIIRYYRHTKSARARKQVLIMSVAVAIPIIIGTITDGILPELGILVFPMAIPLTTLTAIFVTIAMFKYGLFEIEPTYILSSIGEGVISLDLNNQVLMMNESARTMLKISDDNILGADITTLFKVKDDTNPHKKDILPEIIKLAESQIIAGNKYEIVNANIQLPVSLSATPIIKDHQKIGLILNFHDISVELEQQRQKEDFVSYVSHELKNPIAVAKLYTGMALKELRQNKRQEAEQKIEKVNSYLTSLTVLVDQFVDLALIKKDNLKISAETFPIKIIIYDALELVQPLVDGHKFTIEGDTDLIIRGDKLRLIQVLNNILSNAIKYSPKQSLVQIEVKKQNREVQISISDQGKGIPQKELSAIFDRFYRLEEAVTSKITGMGLGLYLVNKIIELHKGRVWADSVQGKGSTLYINLPLHE